jgi:hypothetical protein
MNKIEDMWFALGRDALHHPGPEFREFRDMAKDRVLALKNARSDKENALIIRIDDFVFVETSSKDACLVFRSKEVTFDLDRKWVFIGSQAGSTLNSRRGLKMQA